ncbi:hypothetical protein, partial [Helicobacter sp. 12S02232-10]|uniref:hypothetical protein n=1 Tax=Helicobacter sp. 12S02232-10 TaxID=1476197 RepID=UPI0015DFB063
NLNAIFDNRGVDTSIADYVTYKDTNSNTQTATTNAFGALSDSILKVLKATLNGNLTLGSSTTARLDFYGSSFGKDAKITGPVTNTDGTSTGSVGGNANSSFTFHTINLDFGTSSLAKLNVAGKIIFDGPNTLQGTIDGFGSATIQTQGIQTPNVLVFRNEILPDTNKTNSVETQATSNLSASGIDLSHIGSLDYFNLPNNSNPSLDYSQIAQGGSFQGTLATKTAMTYTFIGEKSQTFNQDSSSGKTPTKLDASLANATINIIDGGKLLSANLKGVNAPVSSDTVSPEGSDTTGSSTPSSSPASSSTDSVAFTPNNTLNLYGNTAITLSPANSDDKETKASLEVDATNLTINAVIDTKNYQLWGGKDTNGDKPYLDFDIKGAANQSAIWHLTFMGNYPDPDFNDQFYTGHIDTLSNASKIVFKNAGYINGEQIADTLANVILDHTQTKGDFYSNTATLDFRAVQDSDLYAKGFDGLSGNIVSRQASDVKTIAFDFSNNTKADKIKNPNEETSNDYYVSGASGSSFSFINLKDNKNSDPNGVLVWVPKTDKRGDLGTANTNADAVFKTLQNAGVHLRAANSSLDKPSIQKQEVPQTLASDATFNFYGSHIIGAGTGNNAGMITSDYGIGLFVDSRSSDERISMGGFDSKLNQSDLSNVHHITSNQGGVSLGLYGDNAIKDVSKDITVSIAKGAAFNLFVQGDPLSTPQDSSDTPAPTLLANITLNGNESDGLLKAGSSMDIEKTSFKGTYLTSKDTSLNPDGSSKSIQGGNIKASFNNDASLRENSILGSKDGTLDVSIDYTLPTPQIQQATAQNDSIKTPTPTPVSAAITEPSKAPTFIIGEGITHLDFKNAGTINIKTSQANLELTSTQDSKDNVGETPAVSNKDASPSTLSVASSGAATTPVTPDETLWNKDSKGTMLAAGSSLIANHTTLIGDLYTQLNNDTPNAQANGTYYNLSFDTTNPSESSYFQTNHIGMGVTNGKTGSSITAIG